MSPKSGWRVLAEEARRMGSERLARSLPADGYFGGLLRRFLPGDDRLGPLNAGAVRAPRPEADTAPPADDDAPDLEGRNGELEPAVDAAATGRAAPAAGRPGALDLRLAPAAGSNGQPAAPAAGRDRGLVITARLPPVGGSTTVPAAPPRTRRQFRAGMRAPSLAVGDVVAERYEITSRLAATARCTSYVARHRDWGIPVVVKVPGDALLAQAQTLQAIEEGALRWITLGLHPHITYCYQLELVDGLPVLIIEYLEGGNLGAWIASAQTRSLRIGLNLAIQICHGLEHAHTREVWHGSLTPENLLLTAEGMLRISDFGAVRGVVAPPEGTQSLIAPELWDDPAAMDAKTDVFALGSILYEMMCGVRPYEHTRGPRQVSRNGTEMDALPDRLRSLLNQCVDWDRTRRPPTAKIRQELCALYVDLFGKPSPFAVLPAASWDADGWNNQAAAAWLAGRIEEAEAAWTHALRLGRDHLEATFNAGMARWRRGDLSDVAVVDMLEHSAARRPRDWAAAYLRAQVHSERGDVESAVALLEQAGTLAPEAAEVRQAIAVARMQADAAQREMPKVAGHEAHQTFVSSVCVSPDGRWVLSGGDDRSLRMWDVSGGRMLRALAGHTRRISSIAVSQDGALAVSGSDDATLRLWDVQTGRCRKTLETAGKVFCAVLTPNGRWVAAASSARETALGIDGTLIQVWDADTERCLKALPGHGRAVRSIAISADGRRILSGSDDHTVRLWDIGTATQLARLEGHTHFVACVRLSADGTRALSASWDQTLRVWDLQKQRCLRVLRGHVSIVTGVALSSDGSTAVSCSLDGTVRVWDLETGCCVRTFDGHTAMVTSVALSADGRLAASGSWDTSVRVWLMPRRARSTFVPRLSTRTPPTRLPAAEPEPDELLGDAEHAFAESRLGLALEYVRRARESPVHATSLRALALWRALTPRCQRTGLRGTRLLTAQVGPGGTGAVQVAADPDRVLSAGRDGELQWWDADFARPIAAYAGHGARVLGLRMTADQALAASASADGTARLWDLRRGLCVQTFVGHESVVTAVDLTADAQRLLTASYDHTVRLWAVTLGECIRTFRGHERQILTACITPDGRRAVSAGYDPAIEVWDTERGESLLSLSGHSGPVTAVCPSADGRWLLSGSRDHCLRLWSLEDGDCVRVLMGHTGPVVAVALTPDSRWALSASHDGTARIWALEDGECIHVLQREATPVVACALSADGCRAVVAGGDDLLRVYELEWELEA